MSYVNLKQIKVAEPLVSFINDTVLPGLPLDVNDYWQKFEQIITAHSVRNQELLGIRDSMQKKIDAWHHQHNYDENNIAEYKQFLIDIGYLLQEGDAFKVDVHNVDNEICWVASPQLVVPINNARFAVNAANARWGSLYDALYGTDMIEDSGALAKNNTFNKQRVARVFEFCQQWLDEVLPLTEGSHQQATRYQLLSDQAAKKSLTIALDDGRSVALKEPGQFQGFVEQPEVLLFIHNDLYFELHIDADDAVGELHPASVKDIVLEAAVTTIQDCEDSVTAVDVEDKLQVYSNWYALIKGSLSLQMSKAGKSFTRRLNENRNYQSVDGSSLQLPGRSLMLVRNTGIHMKTDLVLNEQDEMMPEGLVDALVTVLISMHDLQTKHEFNNSRSGSIYIVKPKMHGPQEVAFSCDVFKAVEGAYGLEENTIKIGIMDEERRTTVNLKECIRQARQRVIFINTGFLDRTGDEIHTSMEAGPVLPKAEIKHARWMNAYENWNVDVGLECGLDGTAQIGKGMWAIPDQILEMYQTKQAHPQAGANCAWVPSPSAATIHALHYHQVNVKKVQQELKQRKRASVDDILAIPLLSSDRKLSVEEIQRELDNNAQGILGYVVKWIDLGIGCSKVPDIQDIGLMEDRATLRISSQHMANWLRHGLCSEQQVIDTFKRMAEVVDRQNTDTPGYTAMAPACDGVAFEAALNLVLQGTQAANGYTEDHLQRYRRRAKQHNTG